jgi:DNA-binding MarR family transcriptional regulator
VRLSEAPERRLRMAELAEFASQSRSRLSHTVSRLECKGLVSRDTCGADKRGVNAQLTDEGFAFLSKAAVDHVATVREFFVDVIDPDDLVAIGRAFAAVSAQVAKVR